MHFLKTYWIQTFAIWASSAIIHYFENLSPVQMKDIRSNYALTNMQVIFQYTKTMRLPSIRKTMRSSSNCKEMRLSSI
jgi:hypothetical protein